MTKPATKHYTRRERQIMEVIHQRGRATVTEVMENMPDPPSYSTVRALLRVLEDKGHLKHEQQGMRYLFMPTVAPEKAKRSALRSMLEVFFNNSAAAAVATLLDLPQSKLSTAELDRLSELIERARKGERS
jgi:predicted transcriptional regulator